VLVAVIAVSAVWAALLVVVEVLHHRERRDLYTRLMAGSLSDYLHAQPGSVPAGRNFILKRLKELEKEGG